MTEELTIRLSGGLLKRATQQAATEGRSLSALVEAALQDILDGRDGTGRAAAGQTQAGQTISHAAIVQDLSNRERAARLA